MQVDNDPVDEFRDLLNDAAAVFGIARSALPAMKGQLERFSQIAGLRPVDLVHLTTLRPEEERNKEPSDAFAAWPSGQVADALSADGAVARQIGHQWVVQVYHLWENHYREEIARTKGLNNGNELQNQHMADLAKIRHDILKHRGIASQKNCGRCQILTWFKEGDEIVIQDWMVYQFMEAFGLVYPASGQIDEERIAYKFQGLVVSPIRFIGDPTAVDQLVGEVQSLSGRPLSLQELERKFCGSRFKIAGPGGQGEAYGLRVELHKDTDLVATVTVRTPLHFARAVRNGDATASLPAGSAVPALEGRRAVLIDRLSRSGVIVTLQAPDGKEFDENIYLDQIGGWLPLVSDIGDLLEGRLTARQFPNDDHRKLQLRLELPRGVPDEVRSGKVKLRAVLQIFGM